MSNGPIFKMHRDDQAAGLRRMFAAPSVTLAVAAHEAALIDAYSLMKRVVQEEGEGAFRITITHARSEEQARAVFEHLRRVAHAYLGVRLEYLGATAWTGDARKAGEAWDAWDAAPPGMLRDSVI